MSSDFAKPAKRVQITLQKKPAEVISGLCGSGAGGFILDDNSPKFWQGAGRQLSCGQASQGDAAGQVWLHGCHTRQRQTIGQPAAGKVDRCLLG